MRDLLHAHELLKIVALAALSCTCVLPSACTGNQFTSCPEGCSGSSSGSAGEPVGVTNAGSAGDAETSSASGSRLPAGHAGTAGGGSSVGSSSGTGGAPPCDGECKGPTPVCDMASNECVQCLKGSDCKAPVPACDVATNTCVECTKNGDCKGAAKPFCDTTAQQCVACLKQADCTSATASACNAGRARRARWMWSARISPGRACAMRGLACSARLRRRPYAPAVHVTRRQVNALQVQLER